MPTKVRTPLYVIESGHPFAEYVYDLLANQHKLRVAYDTEVTPNGLGSVAVLIHEGEFSRDTDRGSCKGPTYVRVGCGSDAITPFREFPLPMWTAKSWGFAAVRIMAEAELADSAVCLRQSQALFQMHRVCGRRLRNFLQEKGGRPRPDKRRRTHTH